MKKLLSLFLAISLVFLCSCSLVENNVEARYITFNEIYDKYIFSFDFNDRYLALATVKSTESENDGAHTEELPEEEISTDYYIYVYDFFRQKCISEYNFTSKELYDIAEITMNDKNKITLVSNEEGSLSSVYNVRFKEIDKLSVDLPQYNQEIDNQNSMINYDYYPCVNDFYYYTGINKELNFFNSNDDYFYLKNYEKYKYPINSNEKTILEYTNNYADKHSLSLTNYDDLTRKSIDISSDFKDYSAEQAKLHNDMYACILRGVELENAIFIWDTSLSSEYKINDIEKISVNELDNKITDLEESIRNTYNIDLETNKEYNADFFDYEFSNTVPKAEVLLRLYDLDYCLSTFPTRLYSEMIEGGDFSLGFDKFKIYMIGEFNQDENVDAYCSNLNNELYIVFSMKYFRYSTFCHELMHALEYRIWDYDNEFEEKWCNLNPDNFEYQGKENYSTYYYENEYVQDYFARDYGLTNNLEDRATVFEAICDSGIENQADAWWINKNPLKAKATLLKKTLEKSFASLKNSNYPLTYYDNILA